MLQNIRDNSQGWIAKTIIGLIVVLMALTGVDAIVNVSSDRNKAAEVNGQVIGIDELARAVDLQRRQLQQQLGEQFDASQLDENLLRSSALDGLIERTLLLQGAEQAGMRFSDTALDQLLLITPEFQQDGRFSPERFDQMIRQMGYSRLQFRQLMQQEMLMGQLQAGLAGSHFVTDEEVAAFAALERQTRSFDYLTLKADASNIQISEQQLADYYAANSAEFMSPEQVVIEYLELKKDAFFDQVEISDDELQPLYEQEIANLGEQRRAAHILLEFSSRSDEELRTQLEALRERVMAGEDFAALAREFSEDTGSAREGGDLGFAGQGVYDPAFEESLFALQVGEVSAPVKTEFGWHLIRLQDVQAAEVPTLEALRPQLERELKAQKVEQRFVEVTKQLEDAAFESADLQQPAQELGLSVQESEAFGRDGGQGITANRQVIQAAFSDEVLLEAANSAPLELDPDTVVVLRVKEHRKSSVRPLEAVAEALRSQLTQQQAAERAREQGDALLQALRRGETPALPAGSTAWASVEGATRDQQLLEPAVIDSVFRMPHPQGETPSLLGMTLASGDYLLLRLSAVAEGAAASEEELGLYRRFLANRGSQLDFQSYQRQLRTQADIERF
ncbi:SurA N-terminal domain-containing protein [Pseudomonas sp. NW5]|uniref:SurA N-terminal domain-containing protein n=1 Tax=Pseudomonas sp. NW5 TaxID=2934934 RepID=UPI002020025F|nr:SurA N-terminal domain-containing protein [Pseudomonas sp. NW5]MCL7462619.1 SurA N-terminal domain-containing protein [Pseudomonas sp. NW5]